MKYIIYSGWWCDESSGSDQRDAYLGDDTLRTSAFHEKWFQCVSKFTNPEKVLIIDSASPVKPNCHDKDIEFLSLDKNYGHSTNHTGSMCGVTRAHLMGVYYAYLCDAEYCVYIEQDAVIKGDGIVEYAISGMTKPYMFGTGEGTPYATQQSFFVIRKDGYIPFINRMSKIKSSCNQIAPENKFAIASSRLLSLLPEAIFRLRGVGKILRYWPSFNIVPFGYGRTRPIDFSSKYMYFQHGSSEELESFDKSL